MLVNNRTLLQQSTVKYYFQRNDFSLAVGMSGSRADLWKQFDYLEMSYWIINKCVDIESVHYQ